MSSTDFVAFKPLFLQTAREHIVSLSSSFRVLQTDLRNEEAMNKAYIAAHSLKGENLAVGFMTNASIAQLVEKIFHAAREGKLHITPTILQASQKAVDKLSESIDSIEKEDKECTFTDERILLEKVSGIKLE